MIDVPAVTSGFGATVFETVLSPTLAREAAQRFFRRSFVQYPFGSYLALSSTGAILLLSSVIIPNAYALFFGIALLALVLFRLPMVFLVFPFLASYSAKRNPALEVKLTSMDISIIRGRSSPTLPLRKKMRWQEFRAIWEYPGFFILVANSNNYWCLPKESMPDAVCGFIRAVAEKGPASSQS